MKKIPGTTSVRQRPEKRARADGAGEAAAAKPRKPRGRPRSFDRAAALQRAVEVFWSKGYEATSISDLTQAMGISPPSLYAAFGDKEKLFLEAIESYQTARGVSCPYCEEPTARDAIDTLLRFMARELTDTHHPRGCLMVMAAATANSSSREMQSALAAKRAAARARIKTRIEAGIRDGDVPAGTDAAALADFYATIVTGMALQARDGASRKSMMAIVDQALSVFPPFPRGFRKPERRVCEIA